VAAAGPLALVDPVTRAAGIAVPTKQVSSSSLLAAAVGPLAQVGPVMRALVTARPAEQHDSQGQPPDQGVRSVGRSAGGGGWVVS